MIKEKVTPILDKIKEYDRIIIFRHARPDGDAVGSTKGLQAILKLSFPEKEIYLQNSDFSEYLKFLGPEDLPIEDALYADALGIVLDTGTTKRISNQKYSLCRELIKIDHHIPIETYGNYQWVEEERSSTCEMIAAFYDAFKDRTPGEYTMGIGAGVDSMPFGPVTITVDNTRVSVIYTEDYESATNKNLQFVILQGYAQLTVFDRFYASGRGFRHYPQVHLTSY